MGAVQSCCCTGGSPSEAKTITSYETLNSAEFDSIIKEKQPMWVLTVPTMVNLTSMEPHEMHKQKNTVSVFEEGMKVIFVSHQWIGLHEPDVRMEQFKELQLVLQRISQKQQSFFI
mmetsp:Transcript_16211/g.37306  ORF Transcript_16211/g.37306 Transcript_16211/m.37306 type:complete len:116 (+) Transcript_16211:67-414(+)